MRIKFAFVFAAAVFSGAAAVLAGATSQQATSRLDILLKPRVHSAHAYDGCRYGHVHATVCQEWDRQGDDGKRHCLRYGVKLKCVNYSGSDGLNPCPQISFAPHLQVHRVGL